MVEINDGMRNNISEAEVKLDFEIIKKHRALGLEGITIEVGDLID